MLGAMSKAKLVVEPARCSINQIESPEGESDNKVLFIPQTKKTIHLSRDPYHLDFQICVCVCV